MGQLHLLDDGSGQAREEELRHAVIGILDRAFAVGCAQPRSASPARTTGNSVMHQLPRRAAAMRAAPNRRPITCGEVPRRASGAGPGAGCTLRVSTVAGTPLVIDTHHGRAVLLWDAGRPRRRMRQGNVSVPPELPRRSCAEHDYPGRRYGPG